MVGLLGASLLWRIGQDRAALIASAFASLNVLLGVVHSIAPRFMGKIGGYTLVAGAIVVVGMGLVAVGGLGLIGVRDSRPVLDLLSIVGGVGFGLFGCFGLTRELGWGPGE